MFSPSLEGGRQARSSLILAFPTLVAPSYNAVSTRKWSFGVIVKRKPFTWAFLPNPPQIAGSNRYNRYRLTNSNEPGSPCSPEDALVRRALDCKVQKRHPFCAGRKNLPCRLRGFFAESIRPKIDSALNSTLIFSPSSVCSGLRSDACGAIRGLAPHTVCQDTLRTKP